MSNDRLRILIVDDARGSLSAALGDLFVGHDVEVARDAVDAIYRIDCVGPSHDFILCDLSRGDIPGPELWAYLSITRKTAAARMVFIASSPLEPTAASFLGGVPNFCFKLAAAQSVLAA